MRSAAVLGTCCAASAQGRRSTREAALTDRCSCIRYTNGAFYVDMPRGCITVMHSGGYAAAGLKHCVRPVDMAGEPPTCKCSTKTIDVQGRMWRT